MLRDVTADIAHEQRMAWAATHDPLTGLANRPLLVDRLDHALSHRPTTPPDVAIVLFVDLDGFKAVNDEFGHEVGDRMLVEVARRMELAVRPADTVARFGGDEFVVLAERLASPAEGQGIVRRIRSEIARVRIGERRLHASVGTAVAEPGETPESILRHADRAMYAQKRRHARRE